MLSAVGNQRSFCARVIDGIDDVIVAVCAYHLFQIVGSQKILDLCDGAGRIDLRYAFCQCGYLGHAQGVAECMKLAVDVGLGDVIQINHGDMADSTACQRFHYPGAYPTDADDTYMCMAETCQCSRSVQTCNTTEATIEVDAACNGMFWGEWGGQFVHPAILTVGKSSLRTFSFSECKGVGFTHGLVKQFSVL